MTLLTYDPAGLAYDTFAPFYDDYTHDYQHDAWLGSIEAIALDHGLTGRRLLDVGCGTGKSFLPMLGRGYDVTACDISPGMVERARKRTAVTSLDDALNYLLTEEDLAAAFAGVARNLRPGGLFVFDLNTLRCYRSYFTRDAAEEVGGVFFCWRGAGETEAIRPGAIVRSVVEVFAEDGDSRWERSSIAHVQRHHPPDEVERLLANAGLELVDRRGQVAGPQLDPVGDEDVHIKLNYFARRLPHDTAPARNGRGWDS
jgi:SAM-dependent methyltransferase